MSEQLLSCPRCGRSGFLAAGLRRHVCRPSLSGPQTGTNRHLAPAASDIAAPLSAMSKPSNSSPVLTLAANKPIDLEKITGDQIRNSFAFDADALGQRAKAMLDHVEQLKTERAQKAVLAGIYLQQVKAELGHGGFNQWSSKHFAKSKRTVEYYMQLAAKFCRSSKLLLPELIGANQLSLALEAKDQSGEVFKSKLEKFVSQKGLTELMQQHGVIKRGGLKAAAPKPAADSSEETPPASLSPDAEAFQQCFDAVKDAESVLLDDVRWSLLTPETAAQILPLLKRLTERFTDRLQQARHEAA
jgi:hypothetical protein